MPLNIDMIIREISNLCFPMWALPDSPDIEVTTDRDKTTISFFGAVMSGTVIDNIMQVDVIECHGASSEFLIDALVKLLKTANGRLLMTVIHCNGYVERIESVDGVVNITEIDL